MGILSHGRRNSIRRSGRSSRRSSWTWQQIGGPTSISPSPWSSGDGAFATCFTRFMEDLWKIYGGFTIWLWLTNSLPWYRWPTEIDVFWWFTCVKMVIFHGYVKSPDLTYGDWWEKINFEQHLFGGFSHQYPINIRKDDINWNNVVCLFLHHLQRGLKAMKYMRMEWDNGVQPAYRLYIYILWFAKVGVMHFLFCMECRVHTVSGYG